MGCVCECCGCLFLGSGGGLLLSLEHLGDDLLLLDEEGAHDSIAHAASASRATVRSVDGLKATRHARPLARPRRHHAVQLDVAARVAAHGERALLLDVLIGEATAGRLHHSPLVRQGVVRQLALEC